MQFGFTTAELKSIIEDKAMDEIDDIETIASRHCHDLIFIDKSSRVRMRHASTKRFFLRQDINSEFDENMTIQESEAHKMLAMACLNYLNGPEMKAKTKRKMVASSSQQRSAFADYACFALSQHVNMDPEGLTQTYFTQLRQFMLPKKALLALYLCLKRSAMLSISC